MSSPRITKFTNALLLKDGQLVQGDLWVSAETGRIISPQSAFYSARRTADRIIDLNGKILAPGFIDVQLNGCHDFDFSVPDPAYEEKFKSVCRKLVRSGVTSVAPTVTSQKPEVYQAVLPYLGQPRQRRASDGSESLGAHVEGPFLNPCRNGIHTANVLQEAKSWEDIESCYGLSNLQNIRYLTAAPELGNMTNLIRDLAAHNIIYSIGHSNATFEQAQAALKAGAKMVTHMFNAMRPFSHRDPGIFGLLGQSPSRPATPSQSPKLRATTPPLSSSPPSSSKRTSPRSSLSISTTVSDLEAEHAEQNLKPPFFGLISDGIHLSGPAVKIAYTAHPSGAILVTDAMRLTGCPDGTYEWTNGERIIKKGPLLTLEKNGRIAGSAITLLECVNNFIGFTGAEVGEALRCVTETPAKMLGKDVETRKGKLEVGMDADLVVLDLDSEGTLGLQQVWKFGELVA